MNNGIHIGNKRDVLTEDVVMKCKEYAKRIFHGNRHGNRSFEQILKDTIDGEASELLIANYYGIKQVPFEISEYDLVTNEGKRIEVKLTKTNRDWWVFCIKRYYWFLKHAHMIDYIFYCYMDKNGDVYVKFCADAKTFKDFIQESMYPKPGATHFYNYKNASKVNKCVEFKS